MPDDDETTGPASPPAFFVAVTASGADTASLEHLLTHLGPHPRAALVVVLQQREALDERALLAALERAGRRVDPVEDGAAIEAGRIYLPAAGLVVTVERGAFHTRPATEGPGARGIIDSLLVSLAAAEDGRTVAVALAGTDGDGTLGVKVVKEAGGLAFAEETDEAKSGALAMSTSPAALADAILPVAALTERIAALVAPDAAVPDPADLAASDVPHVKAALASVAAILRNKTGHDFHGYKRGTFLRRVQRRMQVAQTDDLATYVEILRTKADEAQNLFNDLLIGVTEFFRDPREFDVFAREVVPRLFEGKGREDQLRVWTIGCSTGEEAYSVAILLREHMATLDEVPHVQIFATDLDGRALAAARSGRYAETIAATMTPERLARWFVREGNTYCVVKELREMCIFSQHSVVKDAPFSRLDLVSCRNLLIYLEPSLQARVIPLFHFALRPGGFLFLGNSENISRHANLFAPVEPRSRIFRRLETGTRFLPDFPLTPVDRRMALAGAAAAAAERPRPAMALDLTRRAERLAERYAPAYVIVDAAHEVVHFSGRTGRFIEPAGGIASLNILQLVHPDLRLGLRAALARAAEEDRTVRVDDLRVGHNGGRIAVDLVVEPIRLAPEDGANFVILFRDGAAGAGPDRAAGGAAEAPDEHAHRLEAELRTTKDRLQATIEELESTNEELKSSNEEYQSLNEELQSANEEMETSKEELQSINEELTTVNSELAHRVGELGRANSDLKNFFESTQIATVFLDNELRVTNFTPAVADVFHLVEADVGRPIGHIKARIPYDELGDDARRVLRSLGAVEREIGLSGSGARYMTRVLPYRSTDNVIAGVVLTFVDVTARREAEEALRESEERFRGLVEGLAQTTWETDAAGRARTDSPSWRAYTGQTAAEWLGRGWVGAVHPAEREEATRCWAEAVAGLRNVDAEFRLGSARGGWRWTNVRAVPIRSPDGTVLRWAGMTIDIDARKAAEAALHASEKRLLALLEGLPQLVWRASERGQWTWSSPQWLAFTGQTLAESLGRGWLDVVHPDDRERALAAWDAAWPDGEYNAEYRIRRAADGAWLWHHTRSVPLRDDDGRTGELLGTSTDVQQLKELQESQAVMVSELQHRTRNLISVVRSIADQTMATTGPTPAFGEQFRDRLAALARVQGLLSRVEEEPVTIDALIRMELDALAGPEGGDEERVTMDGPPVRLRHATVQTLALALHELATNARKYGALATPEGRLRIAWRVETGEAEARTLRIEWLEERPAQPVDPAARRGYGRELIERALPYTLGASTRYELRPEGVRCTIDLPLGPTAAGGGASGGSGRRRP